MSAKTLFPRPDRSSRLAKSDYLINQFKTLRKEIEETKARIFKITGFGVLIIPAAHFVGQAYHIDVLLLAMPVLVIVIALFFLSENHALYRAGSYIRRYIEPHASKHFDGWERWMTRADGYNKRTVDRYTNYTFFLLSIVYYLCSVFLSARFAIGQYDIICGAVVLSIYISIGILFFIFFSFSMMACTREYLKPASSEHIPEEGRIGKIRRIFGFPALRK